MQDVFFVNLSLTFDSLDDSDIFTAALYSHYSAPSGFCFDILCNDEPIIDDPQSFDYNVDRRVSLSCIIFCTPSDY